MENKISSIELKNSSSTVTFNVPKSIFGSTTFKVYFTKLKFGSSNHNFSSLDSHSVQYNTHHILKV